MTDNRQRGSCHCGAIEFRVKLEDELKSGIRCNCSLCRRKGAVMILLPWENIEIIQGTDQLTLYQWNLNIARHYFCSVCGIYTHHRRRSDLAGGAFNLGCLEDVCLADIEEIKLVDGATLSLVDD